MRFFIANFKFSVILIIVIAWLTAQSLKVLIGVFREKKFNFKWFVGTGGMPSSHAAMVSALATSVGLETGFTSPSFAIAFVFAVVVLFDAQGVRRASGEQAEALNKILDDIYWKRGIKEERLRELLGHTPIEVLAGIAIGILVALFFGI
ncbi:MAG: divergent PAP2 family protein [Candidatus Omnitrophota bacterium]|nr:divergent PAP2 family protein [Candidatus Omnitrophota bacterium]